MELVKEGRVVLTEPPSPLVCSKLRTWTRKLSSTKEVLAMPLLMLVETISGSYNKMELAL